MTRRGRSKRRKCSAVGHFPTQFSFHITASGKHYLAAAVEPFSGIIERIDRRFRIEMDVAPQVDAFQYILEKTFDVTRIELLPFFGRDKQVFGKAELVCPQNAVGDR